jgi:aminopeptidase N
VTDHDLPLTIDEARNRASLLTVSSYEIDIDVSATETFRSRTTVRFGARQTGATTFIELKAAVACSARLNGVAVPAAAHVGNRLTLVDLTSDNVLEVDATLPYVNTGEGMHKYVDPLDGELYVGAYLGVDNGQRAFACFDQPDLKAPITLTVTAPSEWTVVANGRVDMRREGHWVFTTTPPISPYLFALVAGPLHSVTMEHAGLPFAVHCRGSLSSFLNAEAPEILEVTTACFDRYAELFTEPYPFDSYEQVFVPELNWGAMESPGCVTWHDEFVYRGAVTRTQRLRRGMIVAHEMAHMWFGNLVTMRWWDDIWLSESFAEYMGYQVLAEATQFRYGWVDFAVADKTWGYDSDQRRTTHPVAPDAAEVIDTDTALANFDGISYAKGASALRQLAYRLGPAFNTGLNDFISTHAFGVASLPDFLAALTLAGGVDISAWADQWLRTSGVDTIRAEWRDQVLILDHPGLRSHALDVAGYDRNGDALVLRERIDVVLEHGIKSSSVNFAGDPPDFVVPNASDFTYAKIRLPAGSLELLGASLSQVPEALTRAILWTNLRDLVRDGELAPSDYLGLVAAQLTSETDAAIVAGVLIFARIHVADRYLSTQRREDALTVINETCRTLIGTQAAPEDPDLRLAAVRGFIDSARSDDAVAELQQWLAADTVPEGPTLNTDLRWRILLRLTVLGRTTEAQIKDAATADTDGTGPEWAARCGAAQPTVAAKEAAWNYVFGSSEPSNHLVAATLQGFWQAEHLDLVASYAPRYFPAAQELAARRGSWLAAVIATNGFPILVADADALRSAEECLTDPATTPALRRKLADQVDDLRRLLKVREPAV